MMVIDEVEVDIDNDDNDNNNDSDSNDDNNYLHSSLHIKYYYDISSLR